jgi:autotransporter-associated beta strand protein
MITYDASRYNFAVASGAQTNSSVLGGAPAALLKTGAGTTVLTGVSTYQGTTTISNGAVEVGGAGQLAGGNYTGAVSLVTNSSALRVNTTATQTLSGAISGSGSLVKSAVGTLTLSGSNSYSGGTTISGGRVIAVSTNALGDASAAVTVSGGAYLQLGTNITRTGAVTFDGGFLSTANGSSLTKSGDSYVLTNAAEIVAVLGGSAGLTRGGAGVSVLWSSNAYTGATVVTGGSLRLDGTGNVSSSTTLQVDSGATFSMTGQFLTSNNVTVAGLTGAGTVFGGAGSFTVNKTSGSDTFSGAVTGGVRLTKTGAGTLALSASNSHTGGTLISDGTLEVRSGAVVSGGITNNASLLYNISSDFGTDNAISGMGSLTKTGAGILYLYGNGSTYSGATVINQGRVSMSGGGGGGISSNSAVQMAAGTILDLVGAFAPTNVNRTFAGLSGAGTVTANTTGTLTINKASGSDTFSGVILGTASLNKSGAGTLTFSGANTYSGGTTISDGVLQVGDGGTTGSVAGNITNNASLIYNRSDAITNSSVVSGSGSLTKAGNGTLTLSAANTYTGKTLVSGGTLGLDGSGAISSSSALEVASGGTFSMTGASLASNNMTVAGLTGAGTVTGAAGTLTVSKPNNTSDIFTGKIQGGVGLTLAGPTQLWLAGSNNYNGGTVVGSDNILNLVDANGLGSTAAGTTVVSGGVLRLQGTNAGGGGITVGAEALSLSGLGRANTGGALRSVSGTNTWQGAITLAADARIGAAANSVLTLDVASGSAVEAANFNLGTEGAGHIQVNDAINLGTGSLTKLGTGSLILAASNSYSGGTVLNEGTLRLGNANAAGSGTITQVTNNSTLQINTGGTVANAMSIFNIQTLQTVTLSGNKTLNNANYDVASGTTTTESGVLTGSGGITKQGTGALIVTAGNSFTGALDVQAGSLNLNSVTGGAAASTASVTVATNATLLVSVSDQVNNSASVTLSGGTIQRASGVSEVFGSLNLTDSSFLDFSGGTAGTITFSGISYTPSALLALNIANFNQGSMLVFQTTNNLSMTGFTFSGTGGFGSSSFDGSTFTITAIPEPSTYLAAAGLLALFALSWRRRASKGPRE